ncbi:MAG TPA: DUF1289 domain-containing protein [Pseudolabrys sp.]|jgi:predicted Fe-S protein YdhL (DUF1289 family)|nr:DUF1289 domain-containing protein [Pseudolabrys sp.]
MPEPAAENPIESPCVKICTLDTHAGLCRGCGRTLAEIAGWVRMTGAERKRIMAELPARLAARAAQPANG